MGPCFWIRFSLGDDFLHLRICCSLPASLGHGCIPYCVKSQATLEHSAWTNDHSLASPREWQAAVTFIWRAQRCETGLTSHLSRSLGNHMLSGSCVVVAVTVNMQKIECFLVFNLRSHLLDGAK